MRHPLDETIYYLVAIISLVSLTALPWALHRLICSEIDFSKLRHELKDVAEGFYVFLFWTAVMQVVRLLAHYNATASSIMLNTAMNASRAVSAIWVLALISKVFWKQGRAWRRRSLAMKSAG